MLALLYNTSKSSYFSRQSHSFSVYTDNMSLWKTFSLVTTIFCHTLYLLVSMEVDSTESCF